MKLTKRHKVGQKLVETFEKKAYFPYVKKKKLGPLRGPIAPNLGGKIGRPASSATRGGAGQGRELRARAAR